MIHNGIDFDAFCPDGGAAACAAELRALIGIDFRPHRGAASAPS